MNHLESFKEKVRAKSAVIGVVGLGYVGLPLSLRFAEAGYRVIGLDIDEEKPKHIAEGKSYIRHFSDEAIRKAVERGFTATTDFTQAEICDTLILCVPTPLDDHRNPDISFVTDTMDSLVPYLRAGHLVSLESTTYPGTTEEELRPRIESRGFTIGEDVFLVFSPEREDPGNPDFTTRTIPKVLGGSTAACKEAGIALYEVAIDQVVPVSTTQAAEMTKLLENIHRAVNIGLVNELKIVCDKMGINIYEVIDAAATKPFGFVPYYPGPGLGGHCIPIDPFYLTWKAKEYGLNTRFIELAGEINHKMPAWVVDKVAQALNEQGRAVRGAKILVIGIAYKKNVDDMRESPSVEIMQQLQDKGAAIAYCDPLVPVFPHMRRHNFKLVSEVFDAETIAGYDCVVIATHHDIFDWDLLAEHARLIVDARGVYRDKPGNPKIYPA